MRQHLAGGVDERRQQLVFDRRQMHFAAAGEHAAGRQIDLQVADLECRRARLVAATRAACRSAARMRASSSPVLNGLVR